MFNNIVIGFLGANGDFLCATACSKLPSSIANPVYGGWALIQATLLNCIVEKYDGNLIYLFIGVFLAFLAILSMTASDYYAVIPETKTSGRSFDDTTPLISNMRTDVNYDTISVIPESDRIPVENHPRVVIEKPSKGDLGMKWIALCLLAGIFTGGWSPLSVIASKGKGRVSNLYVLMFLFQTGQLLTVPFMIFYYSRFISGKKTSFSETIDQLIATPKVNKIYAASAGIFVGIGFYFYFTAADVISSTISFAISNCAPLVTILNDVVFLNHLDGASSLQILYMGLASLLFICAITFMVIAEMV
jgi:glucose uptake protein GlcU